MRLLAFRLHVTTCHSFIHYEHTLSNNKTQLIHFSRIVSGRCGCHSRLVAFLANSDRVVEILSGHRGKVVCAGTAQELAARAAVVLPPSQPEAFITSGTKREEVCSKETKLERADF